jgi:hypothetical protein
MRVVKFDNTSHITNNVHFGRLPGNIIVVIFRDKHGAMHAIQTRDVMEIIDD